MYDLNYTFLTELEVDTRQSFDDLSDDLLLLDNNAEESQVVDMKSAVSSWQNYFWKSPNTNKQRLDVTFTDISVYHKAPSVHQDYSGKPLDSLEIMTVEELESFLNTITWAGNRSWADLSNTLCSAITTLQRKYTTKDNIYPVKSVLVTNENPNGMGFGTWTSYRNCYISEIFSSSNYNIPSGYISGSGLINNVALDPSAANPPAHTHRLSYLPASGSGGGSTQGTACTVLLEWFNVRQGTETVGNVTASHNHNEGVVVGQANYYTGYNSVSCFTPVVTTDANTTIVRPRGGGHASANFKSSTAKKDTADKKIKVSPKTYPLSATIWERTS